jgi:hypothetical protein
MLSWQIAVGLVLTLVGWLIQRLVARAPIRMSGAFVLDLAPPLVLFALILTLTARPIFAGTLMFATIAGIAFVDWVKRDALKEPVVFSDIGELIELLRHPRLYLPFAGPGRVIAGALLAFAAFIALLVFEPPVWSWSPWVGVAVPAAIIGTGLLFHGPWVGIAASGLRALKPTGDPFRDASTLGPLTLHMTYSLIARHERPERRLAANQRAPAIIGGRPRAGGPVLVVQCESFFDPRRLHPAVAADLVPQFAAACASSTQWGRLTVPGWGANTMRAEFAVMTGLAEHAVGFDRFNPYFAFARAPLASLARQMKAEGYRTICLHPFDRTFYSRNKVMPYLGFDVFLGEEAFAGAERSGHYVSDPEVARVALDIIREEGPSVFLFAITMDNHGPWEAKAGALSPGLPSTREDAALAQFLGGVRRSDAMLGMFTSALAEMGAGTCAFYGDHLPSLPAVFSACSFSEISTDYVLWQPSPGPADRRDLGAHELSAAIFAAYCGSGRTDQPVSKLFKNSSTSAK